MALIIPSYDFKGVTLTNLYARPCHMTYDHAEKGFRVIFGVYANEAASDNDERIDEFYAGLFTALDEAEISVLQQIYIGAKAKSVAQEIPVVLEDEEVPET